MGSWRSGNQAFLVPADGSVFPGTSFGAPGIAIGEAVFTTTMTGYQEVITDPSFMGQIVTFTSPEVGNVGINASDHESLDGCPRAASIVIRERSVLSSNWRATSTLEHYLAAHDVAGICGVDTRALTLHLREHGAQNATLGQASPSELHSLARHAPSMTGLDLASAVSTKQAYAFSERTPDAWRASTGQKDCSLHVVAVDFGIKKSILHCLVDVGCRITVVPAGTSAQRILALRPDGLFLSNGPGDPSAMRRAIATISALTGKVPIFAICLGHQLLALALGAKTFKLKFGHRGTNQPVRNLDTQRVELTMQNHGFCVDTSTLPAGARTTHANLNDGTCEGLCYDSIRAFSVQFHPEASAGSHDSRYLFDRFRALMTQRPSACSRSSSMAH